MVQILRISMASWSLVSFDEAGGVLLPASPTNPARRAFSQIRWALSPFIQPATQASAQTRTPDGVKTPTTGISWPQVGQRGAAAGIGRR